MTTKAFCFIRKFSRIVFAAEILLFLSLCPCFAYDNIKLLEKSGTVEILKNGSENFQDLNENYLIEKKDKIRTKESSFCKINWNGNILYVGENSQIEILKLCEDNNNEVFLLDGEVAAKLKNMPASSEFQVTTPSSMCAARGTMFVVKHQNNHGLTESACLENKIVAETNYDTNKAVTLKEGERTHLCPWKNAKIHVTGTGLVSEKFLAQDTSKTHATASVKKILNTNHSIGSKKEFIHKKISTLAKQHIVEQILAMPIGKELTVKDALTDPEKLKNFHRFIDTETKIINAAIEAESAMIEIELELKNLEDIIGKKIIYRTNKVEDISEAEYSLRFGALAKVTTTRAAEVDAYRKLAEKIHGTVIQSSTTIKDFAVSNDTVKTKIEGIVKGASKTETRYFSDGSIFVSMTVDGTVLTNSLIPDVGNVFGVIYLSSPENVTYGDYTYCNIFENS